MDCDGAEGGLAHACTVVPSEFGSVFTLPEFVLNAGFCILKIFLHGKNVVCVFFV